MQMILAHATTLRSFMPHRKSCTEIPTCITTVNRHTCRLDSLPFAIAGSPAASSCTCRLYPFRTILLATFSCWLRAVCLLSGRVCTYPYLFSSVRVLLQISCLCPKAMWCNVAERLSQMCNISSFYSNTLFMMSIFFENLILTRRFIKAVSSGRGCNAAAMSATRVE